MSTQKKIVLNRRIPCTAPDGRTVIVNEYVTKLTVQPISGPPRTSDGLKKLRTSDGHAVNFIDAQTFKNVITDEVLKVI